MVIVPCSMGTAGRIANGISDDLVARAADVCLKEKRKLVLVVRESPLNLIHLRNLTQLAEAGAIILPAAPGFYYQPKTIEELSDTIVARILQQLGVLAGVAAAGLTPSVCCAGSPASDRLSGKTVLRSRNKYGPRAAPKRALINR